MSRSRKAAWAVAALVLMVGSLHLLLIPRNRVRVTIRHQPADADFVCLAVAGDRGLVSLNWSLPGEGIPHEMHPADCLCSFPNPHKPSEVLCPVAWQEGREYGVITRSPGGVWRATWFSGAEVPIRGRWPILGRGQVEFDCSGQATVLLSADQVRSLGLQDAGVLL